MAWSSWTAVETAHVLRVPTAADDKYSRGVVGVRTGSAVYPGAAVLGVEAAWRAGAGMVRYIGPDRAADFVLHRRPETVTAPGRVQAWVIGSGTYSDRSDAETQALRSILTGDEPVVVDAGALDLVREATAPLIVTPHAREHARLRELLDLDTDAVDADDDARADSAIETARRLGAVVLLKGSTTIVATPDGWSTRVSAATPWLATAGAGDVLAGVIAAVAAGGESDLDSLGAAAASGAWVHGRAASIAASALGPRGGPITALDVAEHVPLAIAEALARQ